MAHSTKKTQIISHWMAGETNVWNLAKKISCKPSYIASVLQKEGLLSGYFDLYTSLENQEMNIYTNLLKGQLGYKDESKAKQSIRALEEIYRRFQDSGDKAGQHHAMVTALTLFNRARWSRKPREADIFRRWLNAHVNEFDTDIFVIPTKSQEKTEHRHH